MKKKSKGKTKLRTFSVPVSVSISGDIIVRARNREEALEIAQNQYEGYSSLECPCVDTDWPEDDLEQEIEEMEDE